jgi:hypothetical protein
LDKFFETVTKLKNLFKTLEINYESIIKESQRFAENLEKVALNLEVLLLPARNKKEQKLFQSATKTFLEWLSNVKVSFALYSNEFERAVIHADSLLYQTDWLKMKTISNEDFISLTRRKKYVTAREELERAKEATKNGHFEEVLNHLRPAIDLALREKLGFSKIHPMYQFLKEADSLNLPLPSYTMLYDYFSEGTGRIHQGVLNTPFECHRALEFISDFIDRLEVMDIPKEKIQEFKQKCKCVE